MTDEELVATVGVHNGALKLICVCLEPIYAKDFALGYHVCGRSIKVLLTD